MSLTEATSWVQARIKTIYILFRRPAATRLFLVSLFGLGTFYLVANARQLLAFEWDFHIGWLSSAVFLTVVLVPFARVALWHQVMHKLGVELRLADSFRILRLSQLAKYVPGQAWHYAGIFYLADATGIPGRETLSSILFDQGTSFVAGSLVALIGSLLSPTLGNRTVIWMVAAVNLTIGCAFVGHHLVYGLADRLWGLFNSSRLPRLPQLETTFLIRLVAMNAFFWVILGSALFCLARGVTSERIPWTSASTAAIVGTLGGFMVVLAPSGVGITESILVLLLKRHLPVEIALAISLMFRVLNLAKEIVLGLVATRIDAP